MISVQVCIIVVHCCVIVVVILGCETQGLHVAHDMTAIERPQCPRPCHFNRPSCFAGFNPWAGLYGPRGGFRCSQYSPQAGHKQQQTAENTSDGNPFVLSADEQECVKNIGGAVASFLKPYGINVDVGVAHIPKDGESYFTKYQHHFTKYQNHFNYSRRQQTDN